MDSKIAEQIFDELAPTFEAIESRSDAILNFLKDKGIGSEEQLAPYLEQASAASNVRWRGLRVRMGRLFALAEKSDEERTENQTAKLVQEEKSKVDKQVQASAKATFEEGARSETHADDAKSGAEQQKEAEEQKERGHRDKKQDDREVVTAQAHSEKDEPRDQEDAKADGKPETPKGDIKAESSSQKPTSEAPEKHAA